MRVYRKELRRLVLARALVDFRFPDFGINKKQEAARLIYEISKREDIPPAEVIAETNPINYDKVKRCLLKKRYPYASLYEDIRRAYLPKMELNAGELALDYDGRFYPDRILVEEAASDSWLSKRFRNLFPKAGFSRIKSLKSYIKCRRSFDIHHYNRRRQTAFIVSERYDFIKRCPCAKGAVGCGYHILNLGFGCVYDCSYCYLQGYANSPGIIFPENIEKFFDKFRSYKFKGMRIGTGEFTDSLALDNITGYSYRIVDFLKNQRDITFEFKTKSANIGNLLKARHSGNIVVSWSLNPQKIIDKNEFFTSSLKGRLEASSKCIRAGYRVGFHFDPVIYFDGWQKEYTALIETLFSRVSPKDIAWMSIGTFRFPRAMKQVIERRFPGNKILDEELLLGYDNKLRYPRALRYDIYKFLTERLKIHSKNLKLYLCMEEKSIWQELKLKSNIKNQTSK